jgi:peptidoglycan/xylan/chitin deacetylase (PgdA/CDA1 family)
MLRHALASIHTPTARALGIPTTLGELGAQLQPSGEAGGQRAGGDVLALTFDDGPHPEGTPLILDILERHGAQATFFVVGEQVKRWPELVLETRSRGHAVALHGYRHRLQPRLSPKQLDQDIRDGVSAIEDAIGQTPRLHRPPYGIYAPAGLEIVRGQGLQPLLWASWGKDWRRFTTPARIERRVTHGLRGGDVILLHDADHYSSRGSHRRTAAALERLLSGLNAQEFATVLTN